MHSERFDRPFLARIVRSVAANGPYPKDGEIGLFAAAAGSKARGELMVVGQASNGWGEEQLGHWSDLHRRGIDTIVEQALSGTEWLNRRDGAAMQARNSPFWRVARDVARSLGLTSRDDVEWPQCLIWSNLYKVAPRSKGNPGEALQVAQRPVAVDLLRAEFDHWKPKRILLLTGWMWAQHFLGDLPVVARDTASESVEAIRRLPHGALAVVCPHPARNKLPAQILADAVVRAFASA